MDDDRRPVLTKEHLRRWQKSLLEVFDFQSYIGIQLLISSSNFHSELCANC